MKYITEEIQGKEYIRGRCSKNEIDKYYEDEGYKIYETDQDIGNCLIDNNGQPIYQIDKKKIINNPLPLSDEQKEIILKNKLKEKITVNLADKLIDIAENNPEDTSPLIEWIKSEINQINNIKTKE